MTRRKRQHPTHLLFSRDEMLESARGGMKDGWMDDRLVEALELWKMVGH
jgi:hypothetical protein